MYSFPCIICGQLLERVRFGGHEAQPNDGIMCETAGNYGSTVWDSMNGERLAFNICDPCMVEAGRLGRVMVYKKFKPIVVRMGRGLMHVGHEDLTDRGYVRWTNNLAGDDEVLEVGLEDLYKLPKNCHLTTPPEQIIDMVKNHELQLELRRRDELGRAADVRGD